MDELMMQNDEKITDLDISDEFLEAAAETGKFTVALHSAPAPA